MRLAASVVAILLASQGQAAELDRMEQPPAGWTGPVFVPSFAFPESMPQAENRPWEAIDFRTEPEAYMRAVLAYVLEGQDRSTWRVQDNPVRKWYHAPWMGPRGKGREFIGGLTRERSSRTGDLGPGQTKCRQNWAIGFYNPPGGYALGRIWKPVRESGGDADLSALPFPAGTVVAKLLVTEATAEELPLLAGAPEFRANIHIRPNPGDEACPPEEIGTPPQPAPRAPATLRLLQFDVAVRDPRADSTTGWVFGTFVYDGRKAGSDPWAKLDPVGLMWGNDPDLSDADASAGKAPEQSKVLSHFGFDRAFGRGGRMNGPVDNPISACQSCHMTAQWPNPAPLAPRASANWDEAKCWFRNLGPTTPFGRAPGTGISCGSLPPGSSATALDFSLQLAVGLRNWADERGHAVPAAPASPATSPAMAANPSDNSGHVLIIRGLESLPVHR